MTKSTNTSPDEKIANKAISAVISYFYVTYRHTKPDATHFKQNHNLLKALMFPSEDFRTYSEIEIRKVVDELYLNNIVMLSLTLLSWPDLCRAVVDEDEQAKKNIFKVIKLSQERDGLYAEKIENVPMGW